MSERTVAMTARETRMASPREEPGRAEKSRGGSDERAANEAGRQAGHCEKDTTKAGDDNSGH